MAPLSKFDVLYYLAEIESPTKETLLETMQRNAFFEHTTKRMLDDRLRELKKENHIGKNLQIQENDKTSSLLACIYWSKLRHVDYNSLLNANVAGLFCSLFEKEKLKLSEIIRSLKISRPTATKYAGILEKANFVKLQKKKPMVLQANLNDLSFFFAVYWKCSFGVFEKRFEIPNLKAPVKLHDKLVLLHTYSTTVTEGNTATEEQVREVFENRVVSLRPSEILEIQNTKKAIEFVESVSKKAISMENISELHRRLMHGLIENAGNMRSVAVRVLGSEAAFPSSKNAVLFPLKSLLAFASSSATRPEILGILVHFIFVSIHPFADGNGRMTRLLHSWILAKSGMSLFAYDPNKKLEYFAFLEKGRKEGIDELVRFLFNEHKALIDRATNNEE